ncbi:unnamed protein product [Litomosoides sigmodontis]|uniref:NADH dehydrogenase [ubiquinone] 1 beta subcomplex subunit 10 n=1 Tax=Litomosoides sigmodontis TaxID=42156 RepID=A0A3P6TUS5_LITSI|nr:unnamed protein product [Litomosoides sigmodontis]
MDETVVKEKDKLSPRVFRRMEDRKAWNAYWQLRKLESEGSYYIRLLYYIHKAVDAPVTWFREKIIEPMNDKYRSPYYHRKLNRVPGIDDCAVDDLSCFYEANTQFRLDKLVDQNILDILRLRLSRCMDYNAPNFVPCAKLIDDVEESELNFFIKYGEIGQEGDVRDAYMKQKHRMIWERRHPEIMKARAEAYEEHKRRVANGEFDYSFWKKGFWHSDKSKMEMPNVVHHSKPSIEGDKPLSFDWQFYKKVKDDPEFLKEEKKRQSKATIFGPL